MYNTSLICATDSRVNSRESGLGILSGKSCGKRLKSVRRPLLTAISLALMTVLFFVSCDDEQQPQHSATQGAAVQGPALQESISEAVTIGVVVITSGQIAVPITNPNAGTARVLVFLTPFVSSATYAVVVDGQAIDSALVTTKGFDLASKKTGTLSIGGLTNGETYTVGLKTIGANGVAYNGVTQSRAVLTEPTRFTIAAAEGEVASATVSGGSLTSTSAIALNWINPSNAVGVTMTASPSATIPPVNTAAGASNAITVNNLSGGTEYTFTITATNAFGSTSIDKAFRAPLPVVLWEGTSNAVGNFGFGYCQAQLSGSGAHKALYDAGYRTASFFGSTPDYDYNDIANTRRALGDVRTRPLITATGGSMQAREISTGVAMTLADFTKSTNRSANGNIITNAAVVDALRDVVSLYSFWSLTDTSGSYSAQNCKGATAFYSRPGAYPRGAVGRPVYNRGPVRINGRLVYRNGALLNNGGTHTCITIASVVCIAK